MNGRMLLAIIVPVLVLGGCQYRDVEEIQRADLSGNDFNHQLARDYRDFATFESEAMYDFTDASRFANKGMAAAKAGNVLPEDPAQWGIDDPQSIAELRGGRERLLAALAQGAAQKAPGPAARAQVQYDCWVEQQEEGHQFDHIASCREGFMRAMAATEQAMAPAPAAAPPPPVVETEYLVFFDWDSAEIGEAAADILDQAARNLQADTTRPILLVGHADRSGPADYNMKLSERRVEAVADALSDRGLDRDRMTLQAEGESDPLVPTPDGVAEPQNRRVRIDLIGERPGV